MPALQSTTNRNYVIMWNYIERKRHTHTRAHIRKERGNEIDTKESIRTDFASARWYGSLWLLDLLFSSSFFTCSPEFTCFSLRLLLISFFFHSFTGRSSVDVFFPQFYVWFLFFLLIKITRHRTQIKNRTGENENLHVTCFLHAFNETISYKNTTTTTTDRVHVVFLECFRFVLFELMDSCELN